MEITKKKLKQLIKEEIRFLAKEERKITTHDIVAAYDKDPALIAILKLVDTKEEIKSYLESVITALNAQSEQADFEESSGNLNNLEMAVLELARDIQSKKLDFLGDEEHDALQQKGKL